jgi:hypothetical protein
MLADVLVALWPGRFDNVPTDHVNVVDATIRYGRPLSQFIRALSKLCEDSRIDGRPGCGPGAHGHVGTLPTFGETANLDLHAFEVVRRTDNKGSDVAPDVEDDRTLAGTRRLGPICGQRLTM